MTTIARKEPLEQQRPLQAVATGGRLGGFGNLLRKELSQWWGTRTWWVQTLIWMLILNGVSTIVMLTESGTADERLVEVVQTFLPMSVGAIGIGTVIAVQGAIVGERELGTAAWIMSKPVARSSFILAKELAYAVGFGVSAILIPSTIFFITVRLLVAAPLPLAPFLAGVAIAVLGQLFYLTLTLMLGTLFSSRGPVAAIGIAFILAGLLLKGMIPLSIMLVTPWVLPDLSPALALQLPLPVSWMIPVGAVLGWIVLFLVVALWRFNREEF